MREGMLGVLHNIFVISVKETFLNCFSLYIHMFSYTFMYLCLQANMKAFSFGGKKEILYFFFFFF